MSEWTEPKYCALCGHPESLCVCSASACNYCATEHGHRCPEANTKIYQLEARCRELEAALKEAIGWNWGPSEIDDIPVEVLKQVNKALAPTASETP